MLVKNTIIALMAVAPVLSIPVPPAVKSTGTVATTKTTAAKPTAQKVSRAAVRTAEGTVEKDVAQAKTLRAQLKAADARLATDRTSARIIATMESARERVEAKAKTQKSKLAAADKVTGKSKVGTTPTTRLSTKVAKTKTSSTKSLAAGERLAHNPALHRHSTLPTHHSKTNSLTGEGHRNKHNLRIDTTGRSGRHSGHGLATPRSSRTGTLTGHRVTPHGTGRMVKLKDHSVTTPRSGRTPISSALGTGQSRFATGGLQTGFQTPAFRSPFFSPPISSRFTGPTGPTGVTEKITWTPKPGGAFQEEISYQPDSAQQLNRRDVPVTPPASRPLTSPAASPLTPLGAYLQKHHIRKSSKVHQHTIAEMMQLSAMLIEAEKVVNGLEEQMNKPHTVFANLKRKSKKRVAHKTPATPATPATPTTTVRAT